MLISRLTNFSAISPAVCALCTLFTAIPGYAVEYGLDSSVSTSTVYNDNRFLSSDDPQSVSSVHISPKLKAFARESDWNTEFAARLSNSRYSDRSLNQNDQYMSLLANMNRERSAYSINSLYALESSLGIESNDFGVFRKQFDRKTLSVTPAITFRLNERSTLSTSYTRTDVNFLSAENTGLVPYVSQSLSGSYGYSLSPVSLLSLSAQGSDYLSDDDTIKYKLYVIQAGISHQFSERLSGSAQIGSSRRKSTNTNVSTFDFYGSPVALTQEIDFTSNGVVLNSNLAYSFEAGSMTMAVSRNDTASATGGLSQVDILSLRLEQKPAELWRYSLGTGYTGTSAISSYDQVSDRKVLTLGAFVAHSISRNWEITASYKYIARKFTSTVSDTSTPHSNLVTFGLTYNFPTVSTF